MNSIRWASRPFVLSWDFFEMSPGKIEKGIIRLFEFTWMPNSTIKGEPAFKFYFRALD